MAGYKRSVRAGPREFDHHQSAAGNPSSLTGGPATRLRFGLLDCSGNPPKKAPSGREPLGSRKRYNARYYALSVRLMEAN
jgi:hypothetical protein